MKPKLILHIGPHKTGTTALQEELARQSDVLLRNRIRYAERFTCGLSMHDLADHLRNDQFHLAGDALAEIAAFDQETIISSENLTRLNERQANHFIQSLAGFDTEIVYYLRHPLKRLYSTWQEAVKHGYQHVFPEYLAHRLLNYKTHPEINDKATLDLWTAALPRARCHVHVYDGIEDVPAHFWHNHVGIAGTVISPIRTNLSIGAEATEAYRASAGAHRILNTSPQADQELRPVLDEMIELIGDQTSRGNYLKTMWASIDESPLGWVEAQLAGRFPQISSKNGQIFPERKMTWRYVDPCIWVEDKKLAGLMEHFKRRAFECHPQPAFDVRLHEM